MSWFRLGTTMCAVLAATILPTVNHSCFAQKSGAAPQRGHNDTLATSGQSQHQQSVSGGRQPPRSAFGIGFRKEQGKVIAANISPGGAAYLAGLRTGDEIKAIDGHDIRSTADAADALYEHPPSEDLRVIVVPGGGAREFDLSPQTGEVSRPQAMLGVVLDDHSGAVAIAELYAGGPADLAGLRSADRIVAMAGHPVNRGSQVVDILKQFRPGDQVDLLVSRHQWERHVAVTLFSAEQIASLPQRSIPPVATGSTPPRHQVPSGYGNLHWAEGENALNIYDVNRRALHTAFD